MNHCNGIFAVADQLQKRLQVPFRILLPDLFVKPLEAAFLVAGGGSSTRIAVGIFAGRERWRKFAARRHRGTSNSRQAL